MSLRLSGWDDTISALATPPGVGAIGVIRLSGPAAISIANGLFPSKDLQVQTANTLHVGMLRSQQQDLDQVVISLFKAPHSYTGEDVVEIGCHGSMFVIGQVLQATIQAGARLAKAGEFTQRAFLNGKLDLTQAEAVGDLIASNTEASRQSALSNIKGGFSVRLKSLRDQLLSFSALIELELDFSQEDVEFADRTRLYALVNEATEQVQDLIRSFTLGNVIRNGVKVAIIGKPNAGKSTLLNTLLNEERAIVSDIAGTTRDTIEEQLNIGGVIFRLIDTAGIRSSKGDVIEDIGVERSKANALQADIIIHLVDLTDGVADDMDWLDPFAAKTLLVYNKADLVSAGTTTIAKEAPILISARSKQGIDDIKQALMNKVTGGDLQPETAAVTNSRHVAALQQVEIALRNIRNGMDSGLPGDLLSPDIRLALHYLGEITGEITNEDQLDYIFSKFCIGK